MTNSKGYKCRTRDKFSKPFRNHGAIKIKNYLRKFKKGDYVDILVDGAIHKGMPHRYYHGRTGKVFNINPRSIGVSIQKLVRNRKIEKRIHVRPEHLRLSACKTEFINRIKQNDSQRTEANKKK